MGTSLREVIYDIGGGIKEDDKFKAVQIGGPSGGCLVTRHLDVNLDFDSLKKMGAMIGSGGLVVMDDHTCMVEVARFFMNFTQNESCGKCVPCREGTKRMLEILERIVAGNGKLEDLDLLEELANMITETALCGLGKSAALPVVSTLKLFRDEYVEHVVDKKCVSHTCTALRRYIISPERCKGCSKCARNCPVGAISGRIKEPFVIDNDKCIKCGACESSCAEEIKREADKVIEEQHIKYVIFDFGRTNFMDSSGIGVIMGRYRHIFLLGGEVWAIHTSERMRQILNMSGVTKIIQIYEEGMM